jgi:hypothetical protein
MGGLEDFLNSAEQPVEAIETPEAPEIQTEAVETPLEVAEEPKGPVRDEKGRFAPKGDRGRVASAAGPELDHAALIGERRRRQELQAELEQLRSQQLQAQPQQPAPDLWEDPQGWQQGVVSTAVQQATFNARLDMSEMMVRQSHSDFEDKKATFIDLMNETPGLQQKALSDPHPWNFAYNYVTNHQRMQELSATSVTELEARLREQIKAELTAEQPAPPPIPETLADHQSARGASAETLNIPTFDQILKR